MKYLFVADIYSFVPVYGMSKWYDRKGAVGENALMEILQDVDLKVTLLSMLLMLYVIWMFITDLCIIIIKADHQFNTPVQGSCHFITHRSQKMLLPSQHISEISLCCKVIPSFVTFAVFYV